MNLPIQVPLCVLMWVFTWIRFRSLDWKNVGKDHGVALDVWLALFFFSIGFSFLIKDFGDFFDRYTFNNLSKLITYCSFLTALFLGTIAFIKANRSSSGKQMIRWLWLLFLITVITMMLIYFLFVSKQPSISYYTAQSLPEASFKFVMYFFALILSILLYHTHMTHLLSEKSPIRHARVVIFMVGAFISASYFIVMIILVDGGYFWPFLESQVLIDLSSILFVTAALLAPFTLVNNKIYVRAVSILRSVRYWYAFQDLNLLAERLLLLCPLIGLPPEYPNFWRFVFDPEYYLYRAVIIILDSKAMLVDFLAEVQKPGMGGLWEPDEQAEAARISAALEAANPSNDFTDIVETYRRVSRELFAHQNYAP